MQYINLDSVPSFYQTYVKHVCDAPLMDALQKSQQLLQELLTSIPETKGEFRYDKGKWSIKELLCHMMDTERIFCYRALRFSRNDSTELHGFDENTYAPEANAHGRSIAQLAREVHNLRIVTLDLFRNLTPEMLNRIGKANNTQISVVALGYIVAGHETHHRIVLQERYLSDGI
ncbi:DinB family protein [Chryseotalea sanaruensis]|uniref:DinB family protein n=1 Tax=Chryseotalea sanaruensis TaxID=2482724 RepID=A0A401U7S2_9BACT|nr:DinB family protein [Chryseotalea sanaruensis]GCC50926.1 DinB family protein [Chryseotalea sanaruensis]